MAMGVKLDTKNDKDLNSNKLYIESNSHLKEKTRKRIQRKSEEMKEKRKERRKLLKYC